MAEWISGKYVLITGATSGMGEATAKELARRGARLILAYRDAERGGKLLKSLRLETGNAHLESLLVDLGSQASIRRAAAEYRERFAHLHVLINCAGLHKNERTLTEDGLEMMMGVNHIGPFLLTNSLLDVLKASAPARIINYASSIQNPIDLQDLWNEASFKSMNVYGQTKLANVLFTYELARRLEGTGVTVNCLHPGVVRTNLAREAKGVFKLVLKLAKPLLLTAEKGADTGIYLATSPEVAHQTGGYYVKRRRVQSSTISYDPEAARRLWELSEEAVKMRA